MPFNLICPDFKIFNFVFRWRALQTTTDINRRGCLLYVRWQSPMYRIFQSGPLKVTTILFSIFGVNFCNLMMKTLELPIDSSLITLPRLLFYFWFCLKWIFLDFAKLLQTFDFLSYRQVHLMSQMIRLGFHFIHPGFAHLGKTSFIFKSFIL